MNTLVCDTTGHTAACLQFERQLRTSDDIRHAIRQVIDNDNFVPEITPYLKICQFHLGMSKIELSRNKIVRRKTSIDEEEEIGGDHSSHKLKQEQEIHAQERRSLPHTHLEITSNISDCRLTQPRPNPWNLSCFCLKGLLGTLNRKKHLICCYSNERRTPKKEIISWFRAEMSTEPEGESVKHGLILRPKYRGRYL
ncbi:hypothetical protein TNCV_1095321 [Trichonephila clavipes]|nr:hypothetical protein TNCV_1095321 [Trichonephila clavipes]